MSLAEFATAIVQTQTDVPVVGTAMEIWNEVYGSLYSFKYAWMDGLSSVFTVLGDLFYKIAELLDSYMGFQHVTPKVAEFMTSYKAQVPVVSDISIHSPFYKIDVVELASSIAIKVDNQIQANIDKLGDYFDLMWDNLGFDAFADALTAQAQETINQIGKVVLTELSKVAAVERDFIAMVVDQFAETIMSSYRSICSDNNSSFAVRSLSEYACTVDVSSFADKVDLKLRTEPVRAFDFSIELLNETAKCEDLFTCEFEFFDELVGRYPEFDFDLEPLFGNGSED